MQPSIAHAALPRTLPADAMQCVAGLIASIGDPAFADTALASLNRAVDAASWSVYQLWPPGEGAVAADAPSAPSSTPTPPPVLHLSASHRVADTTRDCFRAYRAGLYRRDRSFDAARSARPGDMALLRLRADELPDGEHRDAIYRRHGVRERLSAVRRQGDGSLLAVNLYHHDHQGPFRPAELQRFAGIVGLVLASVCRHIALAAEGAAPAAPAPVAANPRERLFAACPALTPRELDVCERLLRGWSFDGVAADLGLSLATVKTYRARAFERLGLHFRSELFARFGSAGGAAVCRPRG